MFTGWFLYFHLACIKKCFCIPSVLRLSETDSEIFGKQNGVIFRNANMKKIRMLAASFRNTVTSVCSLLDLHRVSITRAERSMLFSDREACALTLILRKPFWSYVFALHCLILRGFIKFFVERNRADIRRHRSRSLLRNVNKRSPEYIVITTQSAHVK